MQRWIDFRVHGEGIYNVKSVTKVKREIVAAALRPPDHYNFGGHGSLLQFCAARYAILDDVYGKKERLPLGCRLIQGQVALAPLCGGYPAAEPA